MATRRIPQDELFILIPNRTSHKLVVAGTLIEPGKVGKVPARHLVNMYNRTTDLANFMDKGLCSAQYDYAKGGMAKVPVDSAFVLQLQAPASTPLGSMPAAAAAARPAPGTVPAGFEVLNNTTNLPNISDGTAYRNAAGIVVP